MDDFGDILYVLAMLAALVFSAIRKSKQSKKQPAAPVETPADRFDPMEEDEPIIQDLRDLFKPRQPRPQPATEASVQKTEPVTGRQTIISRIPHRLTKPLEVIDLDETSAPTDLFEEGIDLRQAVIYSEILKRPYQ